MGLSFPRRSLHHPDTAHALVPAAQFLLGDHLGVRLPARAPTTFQVVGGSRRSRSWSPASALPVGRIPPWWKAAWRTAFIAVAPDRPSQTPSVIAASAAARRTAAALRVALRRCGTTATREDGGCRARRRLRRPCILDTANRRRHGLRAAVPRVPRLYPADDARPRPLHILAPRHLRLRAHLPQVATTVRDPRPALTAPSAPPQRV